MVNSIIEKLELPANIDMDFLKLPSIKDKLNLMVAPALLSNCSSISIRKYLVS